MSTLDFNSNISRFKLAYWWWLWGYSNEQTSSTDHVLTEELAAQKRSFLIEQTSNQELSNIKSQILYTLKTQNYNRFDFNAALGFAEVFQDDPEIQEQLIIIAFDHPDNFVRCKWQILLKTGHDMVIVTNDGEHKTASRFSMRDSDACATLFENRSE